LVRVSEELQFASARFEPRGEKMKSVWRGGKKQSTMKTCRMNRTTKNGWKISMPVDAVLRVDIVKSRQVVITLKEITNTKKRKHTHTHRHRIRGREY
jgi:hypothetical protein